MSFFLGLLSSGIVLGSIYALVAFGFVMIFKCSQVFNISQGGLVLIGGYVGWWLLVPLHLPVWLSFMIAIVIAGFVGILIERLALRPLIGQPLVSQTMVTTAVLSKLVF